MTPANTQLLLSAFSHMTQLAGSRLQADQGKTKLLALQAQLTHQLKVREANIELERDQVALDRHRLDVEASVVRDVIGALVTKRVDVLHAAFTTISSGYADQAKHYMVQQERIADAMCTAVDAVQRAGFQSRLMEIDSQLADIRRIWRRLYRDMCTAVQICGGTDMPRSLTVDSMRRLEG